MTYENALKVLPAKNTRKAVVVPPADRTLTGGAVGVDPDASRLFLFTIGNLHRS